MLVIGGDFQSVGVMRALDEADIPCFLLQTEPGVARYSRHATRCQRKFDLLTHPDSVGFLLGLADAQQLSGWVIACVNDETVEFLARNHDRLSRSYVLPVPDWEVTRDFYEKDRAYALAQSVGVPIPTMYRCESLDDLVEQDPTYPLVLKPSFKKNYYDKTNEKAVLVKDQGELVAQYKAMNHLIPTSQMVVQEFLGGGTKNLYSFAAVFDGQDVVAGVSALRLRQHPMDFGHATTYAEVRDMPILEEQATKFLRALGGYRGVAEVEFMYDDRSGQYKFIEMNGRFWGWHTLTCAAGLNYPESFYRTLLKIETQRRSPNLNAKWMRILTDTPTVLREVLKGRMSILDYARSLRGPKSYAIWSWRDPMPFLVELIMAPYLWWRKGF